MCASHRATAVVVAVLGALAALSSGCATGGRPGGHDSGPRDAGPRVDGGPGFDAGALPDAPSLDAPRPDAGERPDAPVAPGTDTGPTIVRDTGVDAPLPPGTDAGPPPDCFSAADCNDGDPCNGIERCEFGMCVPGVAVTCDDGVACTTDSCVGGSCNYAPNDAACGSGMRCTATGCMSSTSCSETPCRLVSPQCGCASGQACYLNGTMRVCTAPGTLSEGSSCMAAADCAPGNVCVNFSAAPPYAQMCMHFCSVDGDCTAGGLCIGQLSDGMGGALPGVSFCTHSCDPIGQTGCATGLECTLFRETAGAMRAYRDCTASMGSGGTFSPCTTEDECAPGYACIDLGFGPECAHWCNVGSGSGCTIGTCYGFTTPVIVGGIEYGVCG